MCIDGTSKILDCSSSRCTAICAISECYVFIVFVIGVQREEQHVDSNMNTKNSSHLLGEVQCTHHQAVAEDLHAKAHMYV